MSAAAGLLDWRFAGLAVGALFLAKIAREELFSPLARVPGMRPALYSWLYLGVGLLNGTYLQKFLAMYERYGPIFRIDSETVAVCDPEAVLQIFGSPRYAKGSGYDAFSFHRENLFSTRDIDYHRRQKRLMSPVFSVTAIATMEPLVRKVGIDRVVEHVNAHAKAGTVFNIVGLLHRMSLDVIGEVAFGKSFDTLLEDFDGEAPQIIRWINNITALGIVFSRETIRRRRATENEQGDRPKDVLQRLIEARDPDSGNTLSEDQLIAESIIQLIGGTETTAYTLTWAIHLLLEHPHCMEQLVHELCQELPDRDEPAKHAQLSELPYLNAVLYETLRLRPPSPDGTQRVSPPGGVHICGYYIPEGYNIQAATHGVHHSTKIYGAAVESFKPERWIESSPEQIATMRQSFVSFSAGSRACIGRALAWMELRLTLATLVRRYAFHVPEGVENDMGQVFDFVLKPRGGKLRIAATLRAE
ncbi:cytochrome P450 [Thamnocephalis sphaerospora]|uniref:Cytochrome P450 n=1 Tax=Thamnocephalis sphaerospora TaxID=78915 RepID=A0A4P9XUH7_9FUNG|nr:cytochrome P450 [Thamnocephalis sphaerospora]|eukprot:RKP09887.1 cytochrome P450 [Thamnocephalis sphaerospora]